MRLCMLLQTAHVSALYPAFLTMMLASGVPAVIGALSLGFVTDLFGCINHFASGQAAVYYGSGEALLLALGGGSLCMA